jgi:DNA-binding transcriptional MerR regulator
MCKTVSVSVSRSPICKLKAFEILLDTNALWAGQIIRHVNLTLCHGNMYHRRVSEESYSLSELADAAGIEARTIRSYIERGLLSGPRARGRGATYSKEHLSRLQVIGSLRRARPNMGLGEIRIFLQGLNPDQIHNLAGGSISATARAIDEYVHSEDLHAQNLAPEDDADETTGRIDWERSAAKLTGAERLVCLLRQLTGLTPPTPSSKVEGWNRIAVTPDVELSIRADFDADQLAAFRELADLLRYLLQSTDAVLNKGDQ